MKKTFCSCLLLVLAACGDSGPGATTADYGQKPLASLDEPCQQVAGLTGSAILAQRTDRIETTLAYVGLDGTRKDPSALTLELTWPTAPVATCYPPFQRQGVNPAGARVAIEQLELRVKTADGKLDETLAARAWLTQQGGAVGGVSLLAVTAPGELKGSWRPDPKILSAKSVLVTTQLLGALSKNGAGNLGVWPQERAELEASIFASGVVAALWPYKPI